MEPAPFVDDPRIFFTIHPHMTIQRTCRSMVTALALLIGVAGMTGLIGCEEEAPIEGQPTMEERTAAPPPEAKSTGDALQ